MKPTLRRSVAPAFVAAWLLANLVRGQAISTDDPKQKVCFEAVARAVAKAGYANPVVVGLGPETTGSLFALLATHGGKGVLVAVVETGGAGAVHPVEIEADKTPAEIGVHGVRIEPFLNTGDLVDVIVSHRPFRLEVSYSFERHHVLRRKENVLTAACDFDGSSTSSYAKGPRSVSATRTVTVQKVAGAAVLSFDVKTLEETTERSDTGSATSSPQRQESTTRYELADTGSFKAVKK